MTESVFNELIKFPLFEKIPKSDILNLCQNSQIIACKHKDIIFKLNNEATHFGIVLSGAFKLSKPSPLGDDVIVHFGVKGEVLGAFIMALPKPKYPITATAMGPSRFLLIPRSIYLSYWKEKPDLIFKIQNMLTKRMHLLQQDLVLQKAPLSQKIAVLLIELLNRYPHDEDLILPFPLTRKEIADRLGSAPESVIRIMSDWTKLGYIETNDQTIKILKINKLIEIVQNSSSP